MERRRICREMSPERSKVYVQERVMRPSFKKVHVVYYLSRNGHLEHPHYMEVNHLAHVPLRLKDVMDRLTVLRGKGMPALYSWSCKRSYKNGYVWNDLAENDVVHPSEGAEYVLKGSELLTEACTEKLHHLQVSSNVAQLQTSVTNDSSNFQPKRRSLAFKPEEMMNNQYQSLEQDEEIVEEQEEEEEESEEKTRHTRGVSTNEVEETTPHETPKNELMSHNNINSFSSPPSTTSSTSASDKANNDTTTTTNNNNTTLSTRFEDGDPVGRSEPLLSRNSMLFSLIACGGSASFRKPSTAVNQSPQCTVARKSGSGVNLRKGVVCKAAAKEEEEEMTMMIGCMSENPRFGILMSEDKEYFSGSIVESMTTDEEKLGMNEPGLKKSSSYNEERSSQAGLGEAAQEQVKKDIGSKGKCIPRKIF